MWPYDIHPPHVINVATLPSESQNTENVILQRDVTKENCIRCHSFIKVDQGHHALNLLIRGVIQQCVYETKIHNIDNLRKPLKQTWFDFAQNITDSAIDQRRDHLRSCVCAGGRYFEHMFIYMIHWNVLWNWLPCCWETHDHRVTSRTRYALDY